MSDLKLLLTKKTATHNKFDSGCGLCRPDLTMVRRLACLDFQVTQALLTGAGMERETWVCDDCIEEMRADNKIEVVDS